MTLQSHVSEVMRETSIHTLNLSVCAQVRLLPAAVLSFLLFDPDVGL